MGCGCGGASNVYKAPAEPGKRAAKQAAQPETHSAFPAVWNGPKTKATPK